MRRSAATAACLVALLVMSGCGASATVAPPTSAPSPARTTAPTTTPVPRPTSTTPTVVPATLVGAWSSSSGAAEVAYRFLADGRFRSIEILSQPRPRGIFEFSRQRDGRAEVAGDRLVLRPSTATTSLKDPEDPSRSYMARPTTLETSTYTWQVDGAELTLLDISGSELIFMRQS